MDDYRNAVTNEQSVEASPDWSEAMAKWVDERMDSFIDAFKESNQPENFEPDSE